MIHPSNFFISENRFLLYITQFLFLYYNPFLSLSHFYEVVNSIFFSLSYPFSHWVHIVFFYFFLIQNDFLKHLLIFIN